jgi:U4/U6.U5 tri-snRNP-associated protein 1
LNEKLSGQTLGEAAHGENDDLGSWIKRTKKRERELAAKKAQELESQDKQFQDEYTSGTSNAHQSWPNQSEHLAGLKVGHDFGDIEEGDGLILTFKDRGVLDDDGTTP